MKYLKHLWLNYEGQVKGSPFYAKYPKDRFLKIRWWVWRLLFKGEFARFCHFFFLEERDAYYLSQKKRHNYEI